MATIEELMIRIEKLELAAENKDARITLLESLKCWNRPLKSNPKPLKL